ncbi:MAG: DNA polymerase III subunit gamma/tau [Candidatus Omnitrophica bacterium]|nr:DNA polymerase III subunit gamma/tau [Candidatus Omnitrophota bacterium]
MSYIAFARKYRPQTFDDIIGQSHVTTTLKNAISQDRVAHAYLFAGPRGVGKTTAARILAKALNCEKGPSPKPCNSCAACKEITQGSSLDILEIDGASNRGIDEIRNLRDNVKFAPSKGKFKVYIIDEVHMLTAEAFNALLKTLEEPPQHVKFVFATTQAHKVPATILSRCQRFDFRRIATKEIADNLKKIVKQEKLAIDEEALVLIAKYSDGGMRDAQVMLDQMTSFAKGTVGVKDVTKILGMVEDEALFELSKAIKDKDAAGALGILDKLVNEGKDVTQVALGLIEHFRNITMTKISPDADGLIDAGADKIKRYKNESAEFTVETMLYIIYTLSNAIDLVKRSSLSKVPLEAALVKLTLSHPVVPLNEVIKRVEALERTLGRGQAGEPAIKHKPVQVEAQKSAKQEAHATTAPAQDGQSNQRSAYLEEVLTSWNAVVSNIMPKKMSVASYLQEGYPTSLDGKTLCVSFPKELQFHKEVLESADNKILVETALRAVLGKDLKIAFVLAEPVNMPRRGRAGYSAGIDGSDGLDGDGDMPEKEVDPIVKTALEIFGGDIADSTAGRGRAR